MNKIEKMINEMCPNGVEYKTLGELGSFYGGLTGKNKEDFKNGNETFITYMNVYLNIALNVEVEDKVQIEKNERQNLIEYGDILFTGSSETPDECGISSVLTIKTDKKLYLNSFCFGYRFNDKELFLPEFSKYLFRGEELRKQIIKTASGVTRFNVSKEKMAKVKIPIPPLEIQNEIVRILDNFTSLTAELTAELTARNKQYEYYRDKLLNEGVVENRSGDVEKCRGEAKACRGDNKTYRGEASRARVVKLEEIAEIGTGSSNTNEAEENGKYPFYVRSQEPLLKNDYEFDEIAIITAGDGVGVGKVFHYVEGKYALHQRAYRIHVTSNQVIPRYCFHYMRYAFENYINKTMVQSSVSSIRRPMLNNFPVPVPSLKIQEKLIHILDNFESICKDLNIGLPAEIEARKKQYEYYRDSLLKFAETGNVEFVERERERER